MDKFAMEGWSPLTVFIASFVVSALGAIGAMSKGGEAFTLRNLFTAIIYSGGTGCAFCMVGFDYFGGDKKRPWLIIGLSWFTGLGYIKAADILEYLKKKVLVIAGTLPANPNPNVPKE